MDLRLLIGVARRFKVLFVCGTLLAIALSFLTYARVEIEDGRPSLSHRKSETWASYARVLVTQPGFRLGSSLAGRPRSTAFEAQAAAEGRLPMLATIYASFVTGDEVREIMHREGPVDGLVQAQALPAGPNGGAILPIVSITSLAETAGRSRVLGNRAVAALQEYIDGEQRANDVPPAERIQLEILNRAGHTELVAPRSKTLPIAVLLAVLFSVIALGLVLENLNPTLRVVPTDEELTPPTRVSRGPTRAAS